MVPKSYILSNLRQLDTRFRKAKTPRDNLYYSKLAILELSGWVEQSIDEVLLHLASKKLKAPNHVNAFGKHVSGNYGFNYDKNFKKLLIQLFGYLGAEKIEASVDRKKKDLFVPNLNALYVARCELAHTYIKGVQLKIDAPSRTLTRFSPIYDGLFEYKDKMEAIF